MANRVLVEFKSNRRQCFANPMEFPIKRGDFLIVQLENGEDLGRSLMDCKDNYHSDESNPDFVVLRKALPSDLSRHYENRQKEAGAVDFCQLKADELDLGMKVVDVEYQLDRKKITFYFVSEHRIDFRELVRILAAEYKTRIEMRQIGVRDHAKRLNSISNCGMVQCCSAWMNCFESINTIIAKNQNLPMNPSKLSGSCGKLKCCLKFEHDFYIDMLTDCPEPGTKVETGKGKGSVEKIDVFNKIVAIRYNEEWVEEITFEELNEVRWNHTGLEHEDNPNA